MIIIIFHPVLIYFLILAFQLIVFDPTVLEDLIGEYVLNISKDNLKLAALKGKIKLENVELDGDFIGSHVLGAVGLQGFGVLSCWAKTREQFFVAPHVTIFAQ